MANQEQLDILKQGVEVWNEWLKKDSIPGWEIDFNGADLSNLDLSAVNLSHVNLSGAKLCGASLSKANLSHANLCNADLSKTDLGEANLAEADCSQADFSYAELRRADLNYAKFVEAKLIGAKLEYANLSNAVLRKVNLSSASFNEAQLSFADLSDADLNGAVFDKAYLAGVNLSGANLKNAYFRDGVYFDELADLTGADLSEADLSKASLKGSKLYGAKLIGTNFSEADLSGANLRATNLQGAKFINADLVGTDFSEADLTGADLRHANLSKAIFADAIINNCKVYGVSVWNLQGNFKEQKDLIISSDDDQTYITTHNIKDAQFINLILDNPEISRVLNTLTSKAVLILGRFADASRKTVLDALRRELRKYNLLPVVFDFERPEDKDFTETIKTLAGMCYFVIADVTSPRSSPLELQATVPDYQIPFVPIIQELEGPFAMMQNLQTKYPWVLDTVSYKDADQLIRILKKGIIDRAEKKRDELRTVKKYRPKVIMASEFEEAAS